MRLIDPVSGGDAEIPGYGLTVLADGATAWQDTSGDTSAAARVFRGWKPWRVTVSCRVPREDPISLGILRALFEADTGTGEPAVYEVTGSDTCEALGIRWARFVESLRIEEGEDERTWRVSFTLEAVDAVPERREERETPAEAGTGGGAKDPSALIDEVAAAVASGDVAGAKSALERLAAFLNGLAGKYLYGGQG